ncbi:MAG: hypothetical protein H6642_05900 [Caldilineaceae bacterium]|nr:hypothetical protein [Caldilineaceae bacterium]
MSNLLMQKAIFEVEDLHRFFEDWFKGRLPQTADAFKRFDAAVAPEFQLITPAGEKIGGPALRDWIWSIHGTRQNTSMWVDEAEGAAARPGLVLVTYREWQDGPDGESVRLSSALLEEDERAPNGVRWVHVHETWQKPSA